MECSTGRHLVRLLIQASQQYAPVLADYCRLAIRPTLTEAEADQLAAIYTQAETDRLLNFFINELDCIVGERLGVLDPAAVDDYKNQQAWLREHLGQMPIDQAYRIEIQQLLQQQGIYDGPIDGVLGDRSVAAIQAFQKSNRLKDDGVPGQLTFSILQFVSELKSR